MKKMISKGSVIALAAAMLMSSCSSLQNTWNSMSDTGQGATAGGTIGAAVGTGIGALLGGGKGTWIGALVGGALGAGTGALVGNKMDSQKKALEEQLAQMREQEAQNAQNINKNAQDIQDIKVQMVKDRNDLDAIKLVLGDAILFPTGKATLSQAADAALSRVAYNLKQFPNTDITVVGFTDNTGSVQLNQNLSEQRAQSVVNYLESQGIPASRLKAVGMGENDPIASNATAAGRAQNRRVEMYITADQHMINEAQQGR
ncbi:MAG: OmpA family protein [Muribaculaceae bacterium]|nr:OmpA family protein [Muribaculaceae bacterium]